MKGKNKFLLYLLCAVLVTFTGLTKVSAEGGYFEEFYTVFHEVIASDGKISETENETSYLRAIEPENNKIELSVEYVSKNPNAGDSPLTLLGEITYADGILSFAVPVDENWLNNVTVSKLIIKSVLKMKNLPDSYYNLIVGDSDGKKFSLNDNGIFYKTSDSSDQGSSSSDIVLKVDLCNGIKLPEPEPTPTPAPTPTPNPVTEPNPSTGVGYGIGAVVAIIALGTVAYITIYKKNKFPQV